MRKDNLKFKSSSGKVSLIWLLLVPAVALVALMTVEMASSGAVLAKLEKEEATLRARNHALGEELVSSSSLSSFESSSASLGFGKPEKTIYITERDAVARLP